MNRKYEPRVTRDETRRIPIGILGINHKRSLPAVRLAGDTLHERRSTKGQRLKTSDQRLATINMQNKPNFATRATGHSDESPKNEKQTQFNKKYT
jgi:hypothetical protein